MALEHRNSLTKKLIPMKKKEIFHDAHDAFWLG